MTHQGLNSPSAKTKHYSKFILILILAVSAITSPSYSLSTDDKSENDKKVAKRAMDILSQMTIEEKVGQMTQVTLTVVSKGNSVYAADDPHTLDLDKLRNAIVKYKVGSILNSGGHAQTREHWYEVQETIISMSQNDTRLGVPILYGIDAIHGMNYTVGGTLFPQQIGQAATWNPDLVEKAAAITAYETRASAIPWTFSPVLGVGRNPLWPRLYETFGEDVYLAKSLGSAMIKGFQGDDISDKEKVVSCMKHFLGYSMPLSGKDRTPAWIPERYLKELFIPPFVEAIKAGSQTIMINSGEINGVPVHASKEILTTLLRDELGFEGVAVTDWEDINFLYQRHMVASNQREAVKMAILAGIDMSMVPYEFTFADHLIDLVKTGEIPMSRIDESVLRILKLKLNLGLFETPYYPMEDYADFGSEASRITSLIMAQESITLLKNTNNILPLSKKSKVLVVGPTANTMRTLNGGWTYTWQGEAADNYASDKLTILEAIEAEIGKENVIYIGGNEFDSHIDIEKAKSAANDVDVIIMTLGENSYTEKPGDIEDLILSKSQMALAEAMTNSGKKVILVLNEGRPCIISDFESKVDAVVMAYLPGNEGGIAIADVIFGNVNPSGKLPFTYPRYVNSLVNYDHKYTEALELNDGKKHFNPQYEFGFGMSYTTFKYDNLVIENEKISLDGKIIISVDITNSGNLKGKEVVQLYISDLVAEITPSVKRLRGYEKISLNPNETKTVTFKLNADELAFVGLDNQWKVEKGEFKVSVQDLKKNFTLY